jgi:hypothetical protein
MLGGTPVVDEPRRVGVAKVVEAQPARLVSGDVLHGSSLAVGHSLRCSLVRAGLLGDVVSAGGGFEARCTSQAGSGTTRRRTDDRQPCAFEVDGVGP